ncbi:MAG: hypothetical protein M0Z59_06595 [Nitrospiraceae bacterium]|nr:hypothetical protein [Nitrospiraceae bacterium]
MDPLFRNRRLAASIIRYESLLYLNETDDAPQPEESFFSAGPFYRAGLKEAIEEAAVRELSEPFRAPFPKCGLCIHFPAPKDAETEKNYCKSRPALSGEACPGFGLICQEALIDELEKCAHRRGFVLARLQRKYSIDLESVEKRIGQEHTLFWLEASFSGVKRPRVPNL